MKKVKALVLLSGGLDSMLAAKLLLEQDIEVVGVSFKSNFYNYNKAHKAAQNLGIELKTFDMSEEMLELVKNPPSGYGKHLNPCIDCHSIMIKKAGEIASQEGYDIVATGEVLGQRPFSQNKKALKQVKKLAGVEVLRPLSAKLLPETEIETSGLVKRGQLLNIRGRSRERQLELARKYNLDGYSTPAGGCLLTDGGYSERLGKMLEYWPECGVNDIELLKHGRVFWLNMRKDEKHFKVLLVVGRNKEENEKLLSLKHAGDVIVELKDEMGPTTLLRFKNSALSIKDYKLKIEVPEKLKMSVLKLGENKNEEEILQIACILTGYYATKARGKRVDYKIMV